jgi:hypothetical protein
VDDSEAVARLIGALRPWLGEIVIVGGWAHYLHRLHPLANVPSHSPVRTRDADLAFSLTADLAGDIGAALGVAGFRETLSGEHVPPVSEYRLGDEDEGFYAEFLAPLSGSGLRRDGSPDNTVGKAGVTAQKLRYLEIMLVAPWRVSLSTIEGFPVEPPVDAQLANPVSFIVQKLLIQGRRPARKRAQDALYVHDTLELFGGELEELKQIWRQQVRPTLSMKTAVLVDQSRQRYFGSVTDEIREAARIPQDRAVTPDMLQAACAYGLEEIFGTEAQGSGVVAMRSTISGGGPSVVKLYFSDHFGVSADAVEQYGAFNISLVTDLPLFIDPFLLFNSRKKEYRDLHEEMIQYLRFLRDKSLGGGTGSGLQGAWYRFPEIRQTWLGFTVVGNQGLGLGKSFGAALDSNLGALFRDFGSEKVTKGSHLEKLCLIAERVGNDKISDFTTNLIHGYLARFTERFAKSHIAAGLRREVMIPRVRFNYDTESWEHGRFDLPYHEGDYVLMTPRDMLTKDDTWINRNDLVANFEDIPKALPNKELRALVENYFRKRLPKDATKPERDRAAIATIAEFPVLIDAFIRRKEDTGDRAESISSQKVMG